MELILSLYNTSMKTFRITTRQLWLLLIILLLMAGCNALPESPPLTTGNTRPVSNRELNIVTGQIVYVPAYSEIFYGREDLNMELAVTLAIHNTDFDSPIIIQSVRYYDTDGNLVRDYIDQPVEVAPLATTGFLVKNEDTSAGWGSNFIVDWVAEVPVHEPVIEAIMLSTRGTQGISLTSPGRIISTTGTE